MNGWSYISTPLHVFSPCAQAETLPNLCLNTYINFKDANFFTFSYQVSKDIHHKDEGIIPEKSQNGIIM